MATKKEIKKILLSHIGTVNSFVDDDGHNHFMDVVDELDTMFKNELWMLGADILRKAGVKHIKTSYAKATYSKKNSSK